MTTANVICIIGAGGIDNKMNNNKIEDMLTQLITIVSTTQADFQQMKAQMNEMQSQMNEMQSQMNEMQSQMNEMQNQMNEMQSQMKRLSTRVDQLETKSDERHKEIMNQFKTMETDQNFIWEKTVRNERDCYHQRTVELVKINLTHISSRKFSNSPHDR
ncbi:hypothetical protein KHA80_13390 [Anaerobacillus sp. HL2]|nr:hypothetical protein KHA80_13390 [Anaerobacillus sp. HL2]